MCAILGLFSTSALSPTLKAGFKKSLSLISHRGPNSSTENFFEHAILGFNRLSIIDLDNGNQPFSNKDSSIFVLCNGEIFNHQELRRELETAHLFKTNSDCEVILHLYEEDHKNFASKLKGQFAFVIYDINRKKVLLGRDRFGINPLFYAIKKNVLYISSEIKAILSLDHSISSELDQVAIKETLYMYGPTPPKTLFKNIFQVIPGHIFEYDLAEKKVTNNQKYWSLPSKISRSKIEIQQEFTHLLSEAVRRRTQGAGSDIAVYLSGGLDSSVITCLLKEMGKTVDAFSIRFDDAQFDESSSQHIVSTFLGIRSFSITGDSLCDVNFYQTLWHVEHPLIRTAPFPLYSLSQLVQKNGWNFVNCGEGADEMLLGYPIFLENLSSIENKVVNYSELEGLFVYREKTGQEMVNACKTSIAKNWQISNDSIRLPQMVEIETKLSRYLLVQQGDRQSMSHGIEQRFPFLDEDLVDFLFSIPDDQLKELVLGKKVLKKTVQGKLPMEVVNRKKQGYLAPMDRQLYHSSVIQGLINLRKTTEFGRIIGKYFVRREVDGLITAFNSRRLNDTGTIGLLLVLSTYVLHKQFLEGNR